MLTAFGRREEKTIPSDPMKWFSLEFWKYLFSGRMTPRNRFMGCGRLGRAICRAKGHPSGPIWYSNGLEPDMRCKVCGDDLG
jgi:hypothetical protein